MCLHRRIRCLPAGTRAPPHVDQHAGVERLCLELPHRRGKVLFAVADLGLRLEVSSYRKAYDVEEPHTSLAVTVLGPLRDGGAAAKITRFMAARAMNISEIRSLSEEDLSGL